MAGEESRAGYQLLVFSPTELFATGWSGLTIQVVISFPSCKSSLEVTLFSQLEVVSYSPTQILSHAIQILGTFFVVS